MEKEVLIKAFKEGREFRTRSGKPVRILAIDFEDPRPVVAAIKEDGHECLRLYTKDGYSNTRYSNFEDDLELVPVIHKKYANVYRSKTTDGYFLSGNLYNSKEEALLCTAEGTNFVTTIEIEFKD